MVSDDFISVLSTLVFFKIGSILLCGIEYIPDLGCHQLQLLEVYEVESVTGQNLITELIWHSAKHGVGSSWRATFNNFLLGILVLKKKNRWGLSYAKILPDLRYSQLNLSLYLVFFCSIALLQMTK